MERDRELVERLVFGGRAERDAAWRELELRFRSRLLSATRPIARRRAEECVEEFLQHVCARNKLAAFLRRPADKDDLGSYLAVAVRNFARREFLRYVGRDPAAPDERPEVAAGAPTPEQRLATGEDRERIVAAVRGLPIMRRTCFRLKFFAVLGLDDDELAWLAARSEKEPAQITETLRTTPDLPERELALAAGLTPDAFYQHVCRALKSLRAALSPDRIAQERAMRGADR